MNLLTPILNRAADGKFNLPADGWYQLAPKGEFPVTVGEGERPRETVMQLLDETAIAAMVNRFKKDAAAPNFSGLLIDYDHFSYDTDKSSEAAGWIQELANRADGLYAQIRWTPQGEEAVKNGRFRFVSPVWLAGQVEKLGKNRIRPLRLDTAGLTNSPNLRGMVPLSNRETPPGVPGNPQQTEPKGKMKTVAAKLGLSAEASEEAILAGVTALQNRVEKAEADVTPLKNRAEKAEARVITLEGEVVESTLDKYSNRFPKEKREGWKKALIANRETTVELLEGLTVIGGAPAKGPILNRSNAGTPGDTQTANTSDAATLAATAEKEITDYRIANRCSYSEARNVIRNRKPELFGITS
jgi:phage I-like protein